MAQKRDYYEVLRVARDASAQEIKSSYRKIAVQFHPDRNQGGRKSQRGGRSLRRALR